MNQTLKIDWCSNEAAKYAVKHWHYSKVMPVGKMVKIGIWEDDKFIGCVLFSRGGNPNLHIAYDLKMAEICELTRVALSVHKTSVTKIIKIALAMLKKSNPNIKLVISFADQNHNHVGKIYQAGNWIYTGEGKSTPQWYYKGEWRHQRSICSIFNTIKGLKLKKQFILDKYKYLMPLDKETRKKIIQLSQPYPKSVCSLSDKTAIIPDGN